MTFNDGGPAFPHQSFNPNTPAYPGQQFLGMSLLDVFAAVAMHALIQIGTEAVAFNKDTGYTEPDQPWYFGQDPLRYGKYEESSLSNSAYNIARTMLAAREAAHAPE